MNRIRPNVASERRRLKRRPPSAQSTHWRKTHADNPHGHGSRHRNTLPAAGHIFRRPARPGKPHQCRQSHQGLKAPSRYRTFHHSAPEVIANLGPDQPPALPRRYRHRHKRSAQTLQAGPRCRFLGAPDFPELPRPRTRRNRRFSPTWPQEVIAPVSSGTSG